MKTIMKILGLCFFFILFINCKNQSKNNLDTPTSGKARIGVDETLLPLIKSEADVFNALYDNAEITPIYRSELDLFELLVHDSIKMIITSRPLTNNEKAFFNSKKEYPIETLIAKDAIVIILNKQNLDTLISIKNLKEILLGNIDNWKQINKNSSLDKIKLVFDNPSSSTVRYIFDSVCSKQIFSKKHLALKKNTDILKYVSNNPNSIGIIGLSWISDKDDSLTQSFMAKIKIAAVSKQNIATIKNSYKPYQSSISNNQYPLLRNIYIINKEPRLGVVSGFSTYIASERGQRIILKTGILPAIPPLRMIQINE